MVWLALFVSFVSGGLGGGIVSVIYNRSLRHRILRTEFYAKLNNMYAAYTIRFYETPEGRGRYLVNIVGDEPKGADREFVDHRSDFTQGLIAYNELEEARKLRQAILDNATKEHKAPGILSKLDLQPELEALDTCIKQLHDKLELDKR